MTHALIIRYGEIFLKGKNRHVFLKQFRGNLKRSLKPFAGVNLHSFHGRYLVDNIEDLDVVQDAVLKVFGISSVSPAVVISQSLEEAGERAIELIKAMPRVPASFRVKAKRSDKSFPHTSPEIGRIVGSVIHEALKIPVQLVEPELTVEVEIGTEVNFIFTERVRGAGGLPVGVSGHIELLLSGGIDSPVAAWLLLKRGVRLSAVTFYSPPYVDETARDKVIELCRILRPWGGPERLHIVAFGEAQKVLRECKPAKYAVLLYRRLMLRVAELFAQQDRALALATGESLGQVASQTIQNMTAVMEAATLPIFRPLITFDKIETMDLARRIGTFKTSIIPCEDSCTLFMPPRPETKARVRDILEAEAHLDLDAMARKLVDESETLNFY